MTGGKRIVLIYHGWLICGATTIIMHWGYNHWNSITDTSMTRDSNGTWQATILIPSDATTLNIAFRDQNNNWDNNQTVNYNLDILQRS